MSSAGVSNGDTRTAIKRAARRLFALRGIDGVSVRDIALAANQRNSGSINYYFGSKEALVSELVVDGARVIDQRRNAMLDELERNREAGRLRRVIEVLVLSSIGPDDDPDQRAYLRFINCLQTNHRALFLAALDNQWNSGYMRCLNHIRAALPGTPQPVLNQRLVFMGLYLYATLSAREAAVDTPTHTHHFWGDPGTIPNLIDTIEAMLKARSSARVK